MAKSKPLTNTQCNELQDRIYQLSTNIESTVAERMKTCQTLRELQTKCQHEVDVYRKRCPKCGYYRWSKYPFEE